MRSGLAIGLMSGTSADGVTAALVRVGASSVAVLRCETFPYPRALRERVLGALELKAAELSRLNFELGEAFADAARRIGRGRRARVIGSHGQTVWHGPDERPANTLQLGEPAVIAQRTGLAVVADFRPADIAAGGQGAPLVPAFDEFLFARGPLRALVNIGGIANASIVGRGRLWSAFDAGPGNALMDLAVSRATGGRLGMDQDGRRALRGTPDELLLRRMLCAPFFRRKPPKSLDKSAYGPEFLRRHFPRLSGPALDDALATLAAFTARALALQCRRPGLSEVLVSGGGALNPALMARLAEAFAPVPVRTTETAGLPVMAKEAACFAWLGWRALQGRSNNCPQATGARGRRALGKILPGGPR